MESEYNYEDIRNFGVHCFARHYQANLGNDRGACFELAARGMGRSMTYIRTSKWVLDFEANENFFSDCKWGLNSKTRFKLAGVETFAQVQKWCMERNGHQRGKPNLTVAMLRRSRITLHHISCIE